MNSIAILYIIYMLFFVTLSTIILIFASNINYASLLILIIVTYA